MIGPLVEHIDGFLLHVCGKGILRDNGSAEAGNEAVNAVADFRIHVIRTANQADDPPSFLAGPFNHLRTRIPDILHPVFIGSICSVTGMLYLGFCEVRIVFLENSIQLFGEDMTMVNAHIIMNISNGPD